MYTIKVLEKETGNLRWTEHHETKEQANKELKHMKENHFNPMFFNFKMTVGEGND